MDQSTTIEFRRIPYLSEFDDLTQECTAYMKTKQFMAKRIVQQQEEIEILKQNVIYHCGKHMEMYDMLKNMQEQLELLKDIKHEKLDISNDDLVNSFVYPEDSREYGVIPAEKNSNDLSLKKENIELTKEVERLKVALLEKSLDNSKLRSDKFQLYNELNELVLSLKRVDLDKLNTFYKKNLIGPTTVTKSDMPIAKGVKYNIMSAHSQICKILKSDLIKSKLHQDDKVKPEEKLQLEQYNSILKSVDNDFDALLDRKLSKKSKFYYNL
jgi:hypothetical protein